MADDERFELSHGFPPDGFQDRCLTAWLIVQIFSPCCEDRTYPRLDNHWRAQVIQGTRLPNSLFVCMKLQSRPNELLSRIQYMASSAKTPRVTFGPSVGNRTRDPLLKRQLLYQLSYGRKYRPPSFLSGLLFLFAIIDAFD